MSKNRNVDFITDLQEHAEHNINPNYWINRVTPFTLAQWKANKYFAPLFFVIYSAMAGLWVMAINEAATEAGLSFWLYLFDLSDGTKAARLAGTLLLLIYWVITGIATFQSITQRIYSPTISAQPERKKEKKKKYPKRPKNYK